MQANIGFVKIYAERRLASPIIFSRQHVAPLPHCISLRAGRFWKRTQPLNKKRGRFLTPALLMFPQAAPFWRPENGRMFDPPSSDLAFFGWALSPKAAAHLRSFL